MSLFLARSLDGWHDKVKHQKRMRQVCRISMSRMLHVTTNRTFAVWQSETQLKKDACKEASGRFRCTILRSFVRLWAANASADASKKQHDMHLQRTASILLVWILTKLLRRYFSVWVQSSRVAPRIKDVCLMIVDRWLNIALFRIFVLWGSVCARKRQIECVGDRARRSARRACLRQSVNVWWKEAHKLCMIRCVLLRLRAFHLADFLIAWSKHTPHQRKIRKICSRRTDRLKRLLSRRAFESWRGKARRKVWVQVTVEQTCRFNVQRRLFRTWRETAAESLLVRKEDHRSEHAVKFVLGRWMSVTTANAFMEWKECAKDRPR